MVLFNYSTKEITAKIVYYGPGLCGKTTNLQFIYDNLPTTINKGKMLSLATKTDRTLFFDFLPIDLGTIRGLRTRLQLYTVPGQVFYNTTRKLVLKGADGVVFVADSQKRMKDANLESFRNLEENLAEHDMNLAEIPVILQFNKRDLPDVQTIEEMNAALNKFNAPIYEAVATTGIGVHETLRGATRLVLNSLKERYAERRDERMVESAVQAAALAAMKQRSAASAPADAGTRPTAVPTMAAPAPQPPQPIAAAAPPRVARTPAPSMIIPLEPAVPMPPSGPSTVKVKLDEEPDLLALDASFAGLDQTGGSPALDLAGPDRALDDDVPVLDLALDDEMPLDVVSDDEPLELELDEPAPEALSTLEEASLPEHSGAIPAIDELESDPLLAESATPGLEPVDELSDPLGGSGSFLGLGMEEDPAIDGFTPGDPAEPGISLASPASFGGFANVADESLGSLDPVQDESVPEMELSDDAEPIPLAMDESDDRPESGEGLLEPDLHAIEEEALVLALEDTHDDMLRVASSIRPELRSVASAPAANPSPAADLQVASMQAAPAGQQEIHVPLELAIGGQSIRFDLRISLDLTRGTARPILPENIR